MLAEFFLFRTIKKECGIDASILSKLLTPHTTRQKPKMGVQNAELVRAHRSHRWGRRCERLGQPELSELSSGSVAGIVGVASLVEINLPL